MLRSSDILPPPYTAVLTNPAEPPLGSIIIVDLIYAEVALERAIALKSQAPWCPLAIIARSTPITTRIIELLTHLHGPLAFVAHSTDTATVPLGGIVDAVRDRAAPGAASLSAYVASRLAKPKIAEVLAEMCAAGVPSRLPPAKIRRVSRRLHTIGPLGASDWNWLFNLALLAGRRGLSVEELARRHSVEARTFRAHVRKYTGGTVERFRECVGWEWVLEAALRTWDCLRAPLDPEDSAARSA